jgi:hypothetical protein
MAAPAHSRQRDVSENCGVVTSIVTTYLLAARTFVTSPGRPAGVESTQALVGELASAAIMVMKNTTSAESTG